MAGINIEPYSADDDSQDVYDVNFYEDSIYTIVTADSHCVSEWVREIEYIHFRRLRRLVVGLDCEWRPNFGPYNNPVATLQLCVGRRCLVYQILHSPEIPDSLRDFLGNQDYTFVGVGVYEDIQKLDDDYQLEVGGKIVDLRNVAAGYYGRMDVRNFGLSSLCRLVLGRELHKPRWVTLGRWDQEYLNHAQVQYACIDAFVSFEIGRRLNANDYQ